MAKTLVTEKLYPPYQKANSVFLKKTTSFLLVCFISGFGILAGQTVSSIYSPVALTSIRGHYKKLAALSPKPTSDHEAVDKLKFPFDQSKANKSLSEKPIYLQNISVEDFKLPEPPANSSIQTRAELDYLIGLQNDRSPEDIRSAFYMSSVFQTPDEIGRLIGYWFNSVKLPLTDSLFSKLNQDANYFLWSLKYKYERVRPYTLDPKIHDLEESFASSYPGGHVSFAYIYAFIYQELAPEFTDVFISHAQAMAHAREMIGVHYPSDSEAARIFARQFVEYVLTEQKIYG